MNTLLSQPNIADEDYRTKDLLDFSENVNDLKITVDSSARRSLIGIVGNYGIGKSVMLNAFKEKVRTSDEIHWIHFDAWKYPDRSNLWEGFVIDFARQYQPEMFDSVVNIIDGKIGNLPKAITKSALQLIPIAGKPATTLFEHFTASSPVGRVFELQSLLEELLRKEESRIYITVEDADRSGDTGIYFIETLNQFLKNFPIDTVEIKVFIPIATSSFESVRQEAYIKALDTVEYFHFTSRDMKIFVRTIFHPDILAMSNYEHYLIEWLQRLIYTHNLTIRDIKFIIRRSEIRYKKLLQRGYAADPLIIIMIESSRFYKTNHEMGGYETLVKTRRIPATSTMARILFAMSMDFTLDRILDELNAGAPSSMFLKAIPFESGHDKKIDMLSKTVRAIQMPRNYVLPAFYIDA